MKRLIAGLAILLAGMLPAMSPAQTGFGVQHRLFWYPASGVQENIPCGGSTVAYKVYDEITVTGGLGVSSAPLRTEVLRPGASAWDQSNEAALRVSGGRVRIATIGQPLPFTGTWTFIARVADADETCGVTKR